MITNMYSLSGKIPTSMDSNFEQANETILLLNWKPRSSKFKLKRASTEIQTVMYEMVSSLASF
jgi:hypothetical protein